MATFDAVSGLPLTGHSLGVLKVDSHSQLPLIPHMPSIGSVGILFLTHSLMIKPRSSTTQSSQS